MQTNTDSQRENSMTKRLIEAAKSVVAFFGYDDYWCVAKLGVAIAEAERQAADDELPVDEKFLREMFPIPESWCHCRILAGGGMLLVENAAESWSLWHEGEEIVEFMTRKKVRNLVELLKDEA